MNKIFVSGIALTAFFAANIASLPTQAGAQTYYPYTYGGYANTFYSRACVNLPIDLSYGSRGSDVSSLQTFLVSQNFPGSGSWMITGYFGNATLQAVRNFQQQQGLPLTGVADSATRAAITRVSCLPGQGGYVGTSPYVSYPDTYNYNFNNTYPYQTYPYASGQLALTSMSQNTGGPGTSITLYGVGFDPFGNTVHLGTQVLSGIPSGSGTSLTFIVPQYYSYSYNQSVQLYVTNSHGTSNSLSFTITAYSYGCVPGQLGGSYPGYQYGYNYNYNNCYPYQPPISNIQSPTITYLNPASGGVGTSVTVFGSGFSTSGNTVHFGSGIIINLTSLDGLSVSFIVPVSLIGYGSRVVTLGAHNVSVTNAAGYTSNSMPFTVTSLAPSGIAPSITSVNGPTSLQVGVQGTWTITVNNPGATYLTVSVDWGDTYAYAAASQPQSVYAQGSQTLTFTHSYVSAGTRTVTFTVSNPSGQSNVASATVNVSGSTTSNVTISSLSPSAGPVGTSVTIYGTGFTFGNTINFGSGAITNAYSGNGTSLTFIVPSYLSPYCAPYTPCPMYAQQVLPGPYNVSVQNQNGTSNTLTFQVQ